MSLNCLLGRVDSEKEHGAHFKLHWKKGVRSWSGNLGPPRPYEKMKSGSTVAGKNAKVRHHRVHSSGRIGYEGEPMLVRSSGMRRDWSFEDLRKKMREVQG
ncbi:uncharacterized protein LOC130763967 [Actinidia eriantha]|uniref:uncharacterized protein LOC130763967 n=1 Tax=Actinidia eriantha TaxID=165200 RepID=UPI00258836BB|nr:uncharacterized protein LOC130763967 [Actinidia eriantha]